MVVFNYSTRELTTKVVYYGPGLCGKTTNLQFIYDHMPQGVRGKMLSLATKSDRTLFFDFLPIDLGQIQGMKTKVQLYTVPGQVFYNETRRLVLKGADGVVFVADSQENMVEANLDSFRNLEENLQAHGLTLADVPHVLQYNKQDLPNALPVDVLNEKLNRFNAPFYEAIATTGVGVQETLRHITKLVLLKLSDRYGAEGGQATARGVRPAVAALPAPAARVAPEVPGFQDLGALNPPPEAARPQAAPAPPRVAASVPPAPAAVPAFEMPTVVSETPAATRAAIPAPSFALEDELFGIPSTRGPRPTAASAPAAAPPVPAVADFFAPPPAAPARMAPAAHGGAGSVVEEDDVLGLGPLAGAPGETLKIKVHDVPAAGPAPPARPAPLTLASATAVEVAADDALHMEEGVEVTRLSPGEPQEILVPLAVDGASGTSLYRLVIRLEVVPEGRR